MSAIREIEQTAAPLTADDVRRIVREETARDRQATRQIADAIVRACIGLGRALRPDKRWDGL